MPTTTRGIVYPDSSGHTRLWDHIHDTASSVDARFARGEHALNLASADTTRGAAGIVAVPGLSRVIAVPDAAAEVWARYTLDAETGGTIWSSYLYVDGAAHADGTQVLNYNGRLTVTRTVKITGLSVANHTIDVRFGWTAGGNVTAIAKSQLETWVQ